MSTEGPQTQLTQQASPELWGRLAAATFDLPGVIEGESQVSPAGSRAVFLADRTELIAAGWAEPHQYGDFGTELLVYGPRDDEELAIVLGFVAESVAFARR